MSRLQIKAPCYCHTHAWLLQAAATAVLLFYLLNYSVHLRYRRVAAASAYARSSRLRRQSTLYHYLHHNSAAFISLRIALAYALPFGSRLHFARLTYLTRVHQLFTRIACLVPLANHSAVLGCLHQLYLYSTCTCTAVARCLSPCVRPRCRKNMCRAVPSPDGEKAQNKRINLRRKHHRQIRLRFTFSVL